MSMSTILPNSISFKDNEFYLLIKQPLFFPFLLQSLGKLKVLNLSGSEHLSEIPSFSVAPNLEELYLEGCTTLDRVDPSIGALNKLTLLNLIRCEKLRDLPTSIESLDSLGCLYLNGCSSLEKFPEFEKDCMKSLSHLNLDETAIEELPSSIDHLTQLQELYMRRCKKLRSLPTNIHRMKSLEILCLRGCSNLEAFPEIMEDLEHVWWIDLKETAIKELPSSIQHLTGLKVLKLNNCKNLMILPTSIYNLKCLKFFHVRGCPKVEKFPKNMRNLEGLCSLVHLDLSYCSQLGGSLPTDIKQFWMLEYLDISHCEMLQEFPELPLRLREIDAHGCTGLSLSSPPSSNLWSCIFKFLITPSEV